MVSRSSFESLTRLSTTRANRGDRGTPTVAASNTTSSDQPCLDSSKRAGLGHFRQRPWPCALHGAGRTFLTELKKIS